MVKVLLAVIKRMISLCDVWGESQTFLLKIYACVRVMSTFLRMISKTVSEMYGDKKLATDYAVLFWGKLEWST